MGSGSNGRLKPRRLTLAGRDGVPLAASLFEPERADGLDVVIAGALGVPQQYYYRFADFLADRGHRVLCFDYRGVGESLDCGLRGRDVRMSDWGAQDIDAALRHFVDERQRPLAVVAHSCGGQLLGLAPAGESVSAAAFVSCQQGHWRLWPWPWNLGMWALWQIGIGLLSVGHDRFPARALGISSVNVPTGVTRQWARWGRRRDYLFADDLGLDTSRYAGLSFPLVSYAISDDRYAPRAAVEALLERYPGCDRTLVDLEPADAAAKAIGHFGYFRASIGKPLWPRLAERLEHAAKRG